ncbi:Thrombospondin-2 [Schistosoma japonicum]|uniref:Thrombospondin-2 n=1 Tax=Schistosoma japonicum TaxID=6182 RepID=A0A4Z2DIG3_SCHJA|nr:Thrombospondin-2 [Schistosoma japonicum]
MIFQGNTIDFLINECSNKSEWGLWRCPGIGIKCLAETATRYKCIGGNCTNDSVCSKLENYSQIDSCVKVLERGECEPWWSEWSSWSKCTATCGFTTKRRFRSCIGAMNNKSDKVEVKESISKSCASDKRMKEAEVVPCPIRSSCLTINGGWGQWSEFTECSVTCGVGKRVRRRQCDYPRPQNGGLYCQGTDYQEVFCEGFLPCPQTGQWCPWSPTVQQCTRSCGTRGMGLRTRQCACPKPSQDGSHCEIPPEVEKIAISLSNDNTTDIPTELALAAILKGEGLWEPCNRHHCPYLRTLDNKENSLISEDLKLQKAEDTWILSSGTPQKINGPIKLFCPSSRISRREIFDKPDRFPKSKFYWTRSTPASFKESYDTPGIPIVNTDLYLLENDYLVIRRLKPSTVGIYRFGYEYEPGYFETVCFFPVYIHHWQQVLKHGDTFDLVCNSLGLWPIISRSTSTKWFIYWNITLLEKNEEQNIMKKHKLWWYTQLNNLHINSIDNQTNSPQFTIWDIEYRRLYDVIKTMTGYYECQVLNQINATYNRTFTTQSIHLVVMSPPNIWTLVKEWCLQNQISLMILIIIGIITSLSYATHLWIITKKIAKLEIKKKEESKNRQNDNFDDIHIIN